MDNIITVKIAGKIIEMFFIFKNTPHKHKSAEKYGYNINYKKI